MQSLQMKAVCPFEMSGISNPATQLNIPEDLTQVTRCLVLVGTVFVCIIYMNFRYQRATCIDCQFSVMTLKSVETVTQ
jgi:hypothetical protein